MSSHHTALQFLLLLITVFVSSFISLCIPLTGLSPWIANTRPVLTTLIFTLVSYLTVHYCPAQLRPSCRASETCSAEEHTNICELSHHPSVQTRNAVRMLVSSFIAGGDAHISTPFYTVGWFASLIGMEQIAKSAV